MIIVLIMLFNLGLNVAGLVPTNLSEFQLWHVILLVTELVIAYLYHRVKLEETR